MVCKPARVGKQQGRAAVLDDLALLRAQFDAIPRIIEDIDIRNSRFSGAALQRIRYLLRQDRRTEGQLQFIVHALAKGDGPDLDFDVYKCELLADGFLYTPPTDRPRPNTQRLSKRTDSDGERIRRGAARKVRRMFNRRRVEEFVDEMLAGQRHRQSKQRCRTPARRVQLNVRVTLSAGKIGRAHV